MFVLSTAFIQVVNVCVVNNLQNMLSLFGAIVVVIIWCIQTGLCAISDLKRVFDDDSWRKFTIAGAVAPDLKNVQLSSAVNHGHACTFHVLLVILAYKINHYQFL